MLEKKIILASTSAIRKEMMLEENFKFESIAPECNEDSLKDFYKGMAFYSLALELAKAKAKSISDKYPNAYVIGSDQICEYEGEAISKSKNKQEAFDCLKKLSGKTHFQNNGTCIYFSGNPVMEFSDKAILTMKHLSNEDIENYIKKDYPIGCAGSYKFELNGKYLFSKIEGSEECIKGFSISKVKQFFNT